MVETDAGESGLDSLLSSAAFPGPQAPRTLWPLVPVKAAFGPKDGWCVGFPIAVPGGSTKEHEPWGQEWTRTLLFRFFAMFSPGQLPRPAGSRRGAHLGACAASAKPAPRVRTYLGRMQIGEGLLSHGAMALREGARFTLRPGSRPIRGGRAQCCPRTETTGSSVPWFSPVKWV